METNPTLKTQKRILEILEKSENPMSLSSIAKKSRTSVYQVKASIEFLEGLGVLKIIRTESGGTIIIYPEATQ